MTRRRKRKFERKPAPLKIFKPGEPVKIIRSGSLTPRPTHFRNGRQRPAAARSFVQRTKFPFRATINGREATVYRDRIVY